MQSPDHPDLPFVQAKYYASGRGGRRVLWVVIHDMEAGESSTRAESTAEYFRTMPDGRTVSSHYTVDDTSVVQCVRLADTAYTVGNRPGNQQGVNWELSGFARQTRDEWLDEFGLSMFAQMAPYVRADAARFRIPLRRCSVADLQAFRPGVTSHNDLRLAFGGTTHTDPGPNFPWDVFLATMIVTTEDDMTPEQANALTDCLQILTGMAAGATEVPVHDRDGRLSLVPLYRRIAAEVLIAEEEVAAEALAAVREAAREGAAAGAPGPSLDEIRTVVDSELDEHARAGADQD